MQDPVYLSAERGTNKNDMTPEEILSRAECFDPVQLVRDMAASKGMTPQEWADAYNKLEPPQAVNREGIMRLALQMIVQQCGGYEAGGYDLVTRIQRTAEQALKECA